MDIFFFKKLTVFKELPCIFRKTKDTRTLAEAKARIAVRRLVLVSCSTNVFVPDVFSVHRTHTVRRGILCVL